MPSVTLPERGRSHDEATVRRLALRQALGRLTARQRTFEVRDLWSGQTWKAPLTISKRDLGGEWFLRPSPDGLHLIYANWGNSRHKPYSVLVDMEKGRTTELDSGWFPVSVGDGGRPVVLAKPYDTTTRVRVTGGRPITVKEFTYGFSALGPDGRTLARIGTTFDPAARPMVQKDRTIVTIDAVDGGRERKTPIDGLPKELSPSRLGAWVSDTEVTMLAVPESPRPNLTSALYAVDVHTGRTRQLRRFDARMDNGVLPGLVQ
ncbi:hypothetical protein [Streptosporangium carneum]|uniref:Uncharacterized protein n=1 Tax=Streptosporangium carneum TaxID=47481 RepID=A0A9W6HZ60_9ACTN|nr:hypothetical protein [Streptosporangium carneum]GLK08030.1 hypothetical protein GCM10017600_14350 [Streptosporangium carneum]